MCTLFGNECFYRKFHNETIRAEKCKCLPGCNEVKYKYYIDSQQTFSPLQVTEFCKVNTSHYLYISQREEEKLDVIRLTNMGYNMQDRDMTKNLQNRIVEVCKEYVSTQFARIRIRIDGATHLKRIQTLKYSSSDKFAIIGGTFGLFTGFSFIAIFEFFHWLLVTIFKLVWQKDKPTLPEVIQEDPMAQEIRNLKTTLLREFGQSSPGFFRIRI